MRTDSEHHRCGFLLPAAPVPFGAVAVSTRPLSHQRHGPLTPDMRGSRHERSAAPKGSSHQGTAPHVLVTCERAPPCSVCRGSPFTRVSGLPIRGGHKPVVNTVGPATQRHHTYSTCSIFRRDSRTPSASPCPSSSYASNAPSHAERAALKSPRAW